HAHGASHDDEPIPIAGRRRLLPRLQPRDGTFVTPAFRPLQDGAGILERHMLEKPDAQPSALLSRNMHEKRTASGLPGGHPSAFSIASYKRARFRSSCLTRDLPSASSTSPARTAKSTTREKP